VGRRPPVDTIILKKFNEFWSVYSRVRVRLNQSAQFWARKLKSWPVSLTKNSGSPPGTARKILQLQRGLKVTKHGTECLGLFSLSLYQYRCCSWCLGANHELVTTSFDRMTAVDPPAPSNVLSIQRHQSRRPVAGSCTVGPEIIGSMYFVFYARKSAGDYSSRHSQILSFTESRYRTELPLTDSLTCCRFPVLIVFFLFWVLVFVISLIMCGTLSCPFLSASHRIVSYPQ